jgi:hypothetical protein
MSQFPEKIGEPVFLGIKWTLEVVKLPNGKIAGYGTDAHSAHTYPVNDPSYPKTDKTDRLPARVIKKLEVLMRKAGWVEDHYLYLKPEYLRELAAKGNGRRLPVEYADTTMARLYYPGDVNYDMYVENYTVQKHAYELWLALPKGIRCAFRGAGDTMPVYNHDLVDRM